MPQKSTAAPSWIKNLRRSIKDRHGAGWGVREQSGRVKLSRRWQDGTTSSAMLDMPWDRTCIEALPVAITAIKQRMESANLSLSEAVALQSEATHVTSSTGTTSLSGSSLDWEALIERFEKHKIGDTGETKPATFRRMYAPVMRKVLEVATSKPKPNNGREVLCSLRDNYGGKPGSQGRRLRCLYSAQLLRFAVEHCGAEQRWLPPSSLTPFIGKRLEPKADSTPLTDAQAARLLEGIPDPRWRLAVGLMICFGLRPVELKHITPTRDGLRLHCSYGKRTSVGSTKPRDITGIDPIGLPGLSGQLLAQLALSGKVADSPKLPPLGTTDMGVSRAINTYLLRRKVWQELKAEAIAAGEAITVYSCRHGFALRCHEAAELSVRIAAAQMGHSPQTHSNHYGKWVDADTMATAMQRAQARVEARQLEHSKETAG